MTYKNTTLNRHNFSTKFALAVMIAAALLPALLLFVPKAHAASLTSSYVRPDRLATSTSNDNTLVVFTVATGNATTEDEVDVQFPSSTYITVGASPTVTTTGCAADSGATALPGTLVAAKSSQNVNVTGVTNLTASTAYCFYINAGVSTTATAIPTTGGLGDTIITTKAASAPVDTTTVEMTTITNDAVLVTATVSPYLSFTLSANADPLGALSQTSVVSSGTPRVVQVATNAAHGWLAWAKDTNAGLRSPSLSRTIATTGTINATPETISSGAEGYGLAVAITNDSSTGGGGATGTVTVAPEYAASGTQVGTLSSSAYQLFASADGPTDDDRVSLTFRAAIGPLTRAANDYADTVYITGAGNF